MRPKKNKGRTHPQVLIRDCIKPILNLTEFDAGNLHARWVTEGRREVYRLTSYDTLIAQYTPSNDQESGVWVMRHYDVMTKTTRYHSNVILRAIRQYLYQA